MKIKDIINYIQLELEVEKSSPIIILRELQKYISESIYVYYKSGIISNKEDIFYLFVKLYCSRNESNIILNSFKDIPKEDISNIDLIKSILYLNSFVSMQILTKKKDSIDFYHLCKLYKAL